MVMIDHLPAHLRGLMVAAFAAAYMSTIGTQLNWGASYLVNDFYRRFLRPNESERTYVRISQLATVLLTVISAVVTFYMDSIAGAWQLLIGIGAGTGTVLILRWYWWRINAWSEVSAMTSALIVSTMTRLHYGLSNDDPLVFAKSTLITVGVTTVVGSRSRLGPRPNQRTSSSRSIAGCALRRRYGALLPAVPGCPAHPRLRLEFRRLDLRLRNDLLSPVRNRQDRPARTRDGFRIHRRRRNRRRDHYWDLSRRGWSSIVEYNSWRAAQTCGKVK
jgi:hypothetical protein